MRHILNADGQRSDIDSGVVHLLEEIAKCVQGGLREELILTISVEARPDGTYHIAYEQAVGETDEDILYAVINGDGTREPLFVANGERFLTLSMALEQYPNAEVVFLPKGGACPTQGEISHHFAWKWNPAKRQWGKSAQSGSSPEGHIHVDGGDGPIPNST